MIWQGLIFCMTTMALGLASQAQAKNQINQFVGLLMVIIVGVSTSIF